MLQQQYITNLDKSKKYNFITSNVILEKMTHDLFVPFITLRQKETTPTCSRPNKKHLEVLFM